MYVDVCVYNHVSTLPPTLQLTPPPSHRHPTPKTNKQTQLGRALQAVNVGGAFNMTEEGLLHLVTHHPNRQKYVHMWANG